MQSTEALRRWLVGKCRRGKPNPNDRYRDFSMAGFCRTLSVQPPEIYKWLDGKKGLPLRVQRLMTRFAADWEAGLLEFTPYRPRHKRALVRLAKPKARGRFTVDLSGRSPRLTLLPKPPRDEPMPTMRELIRPRLTS